MGKLAVYKYFSFMFLVVTVLVSSFTFFGLFGGTANPATGTAMAMLVYVLPHLIIANFILAVFWIVRRRWHWLCIPVVTILCCIPYMGTILQVRIFTHPDENKAGFKIATYNVAMFGREISGFKAEDILSEMKKQKTDILCMQEFMEFSGDKDNFKKYKEFFTYAAKGKDDMVVFSRFPINGSEMIDFGTHTNNSAMWVDIDINGINVRLFNVHLETTGFNRTLHKFAKLEQQGAQLESNAFLRAIYDNYTVGMIIRARQANIVAQKIKESPYPVIVCGDFNDVAYSYVYNTMLGNLVDGFKECGDGFMYTYRSGREVRIDYIFHDETLTGENYYKQELSYSDHYPVFMRFSF